MKLDRLYSYSYITKRGVVYMEFIKGYMDSAQYRHALNDLTQAIFGFSFETWYTAGYFEGEYIPY